MAGACVYSGDVAQALDLKNQHVFWVGAGRTATWADEQNPPDEALTTTDIDTPQAFKKADVVSLAKIDGGGTITFEGQTYSLVADINAYTDVARYLYVKAEFRYDDFPLITFRQTGLYLDLTPNGGFESDDPILIANVSDNGILRYYRNHVARIRTIDTVDIVELIITLTGQNT